MKVVVKDANILIDFANSSLFRYWYQLSYETWTTDLVLAQVRREHQWKEVIPCVESGELKVQNVTEEMLNEIQSVPYQNKLGPEDTSALLLARDLNAILLTGDRQLRKQSEQLEIEVHGMLWVLDKLVKENIIESGKAARKLENIIAQGALLPPDESEKLIRRWKRS